MDRVVFFNLRLRVERKYIQEKFYSWYLAERLCVGEKFSLRNCKWLFNIVTLQIIFDGFTVGRFDEGVADNEFETTDVSLMLSSSGAELPGCPDGFMQVRLELSFQTFHPFVHSRSRNKN